MQVHCGEGVANHSAPSRAHAFARTRVKPRGAGRHRLLDDLLQLSPPAPGDEQPDADGGMARRHGQDRGGGEGCGYAASLGQRERVAHIPTAETEAARSGLILEGQGQERLHLKSNPPWSHEWGPVHAAGKAIIDSQESQAVSPRFRHFRSFAILAYGS